MSVRPTDGGAFWYPSAEDVVAVHADVVEEYQGTEPGVRDRGGVDAAVGRARRAGRRHGDVHRAALERLRLLTANHPFVDANKRTALATVAMFYTLNGYEFDYDHDVRRFLREFATDESGVDRSEALAYPRSNTEPTDLESVVQERREPLLRRGLDDLRRRRADREGDAEDEG